MKTSLVFEYVLTPQGLLGHHRIITDSAGIIEEISPANPNEPTQGWLAVPAMPNAHSHVFQRAMAGLAEVAHGEDSFWSWRELMYALAEKITPEDLYNIARQAFVEMVKAGYGTVGEFHYLHHLPEGAPAMADAVLAAAAETGLRLVMLPVFYRKGGFNKAPQPRQRRFVHGSVESYLKLVEHCSKKTKTGLAPHSLRAVPLAEMRELLAAAPHVLGEDFPIHIHISEQRGEVAECEQTVGVTPINYLAENIELDARWSFVHATHAGADELEKMAAAKVTALLCPLTEAHLGDGLFPAEAWLKKGGDVAIGSDSNARICPIEEMRLLEYGQRLKLERRNVLGREEAGTGQVLWQALCAGGGKSLRTGGGRLEAGATADFIVLNREADILLGHTAQTALDALLVGGGASCVKDVYVAGRQLVHGGHHKLEEEARRGFTQTMNRLRP